MYGKMLTGCHYFLSCRELVDKNPSAHTCLLLGDAYMSIQEVSACSNLPHERLSEWSVLYQVYIATSAPSSCRAYSLVKKILKLISQLL